MTKEQQKTKIMTDTFCRRTKTPMIYGLSEMEAKNEDKIIKNKEIMITIN